jgi:hypothetical protein
MASVDDPPFHLHDASVPETRSGSRSGSRSRSRLRLGSGGEPRSRSRSRSHSRSRSTSRSDPTLPMTPPDTDGDKEAINGSHAAVSRNLDYLVHKLNRKPILQDSVRWHYLREESQIQDTEQLAPFTRISMQPLEPTPTLEPISELSMRYNNKPSMYPTHDILLPPASILLDSQAADLQPEDKHLPRPSDTKRSRRSTDTRLHRSASNLRMLSLVTDMIENGVQCQVQTSTPPSPTKASIVLSSPTHVYHNEAQDRPDPEILPSRMELEVDMNLGAVDEGPAVSEALALRQASSPAGISKFGVLRYRSSSEAAHSCKNMRKSVPRMRRRHRTNTTPTTASSVPMPPTAV